VVTEGIKCKDRTVIQKEANSRQAFQAVRISGKAGKLKIHKRKLYIYFSIYIKTEKKNIFTPILF